jgi:hypothetical protein
MTRYLSGDLVRSGALLQEAGSGRIVAHLQETVGLEKMAVPSFDPASMMAQGVQIYQNEQIKAGIALVQNLQMANLARTGVSIGVSVAGFAIPAGKLDRIEERLSVVGSAIDRLGRRVEGVQAHLIRSELAALRAELRWIDEAWSRADAEAQWRIAADRLLTLEQTFLDHAGALGHGSDEAEPREQMVDAFAMAGSVCITAMLATGEEKVAESAAYDFARSLAGLTGRIGAPQLLRRMLERDQAPTDPTSRVEAIKRLRTEAEEQAAALREREDAAATAPLTIAALARVRVPGRAWLERARGETDAPLICLIEDEAE